MLNWMFLIGWNRILVGYRIKLDVFVVLCYNSFCKFGIWIYGIMKENEDFILESYYCFWNYFYCV